MTAGGWMFMLGSVSAVIVLVGWCFWKVLSLPPHDDSPVPPAEK
jgi:hypothetical protein